MKNLLIGKSYYGDVFPMFWCDLAPNDYDFCEFDKDIQSKIDEVLSEVSGGVDQFNFEVWSHLELLETL